MNFDDSEPDEREEHDSTNNSNKDEGAGPACHACRKKKAKCSRQMPCSQCVKTGAVCIYDKDKGKPGMRAGAIERLTQRLENLENMFLGQGVLWQSIWNSLQAHQNHRSDFTPESSDLSECTQQLRQTLQDLGRKRCADAQLVPESDTTKRRRGQRLPPTEPTVDPQHNHINDGVLPPDLIDSLVEIYFSRIHAWIPILHVRQSRRRMGLPNEREKLNTVLRAITSVTVRFSDDPRLGDTQSKIRLAQSNRQAVVLQSMESFSVENLQALIICAFDTIGSGRGPSAWSIVGSMARTVEQLQLSVEDEDQLSSPGDTQALVQRMHFLPSCTSWIEREERRRVFWNIFLMDRFCSIATGWNVCLSSADVKRRLPCEGALWEEGEPLHTMTPYFGVSDPPGNTGKHLPKARTEEADQASLGGFAYCIEATESLSLVTSFFLQQAVDITKAHDVELWSMRFKQLDLRLIQWKMFLPERWKEARALNDDGNMDPNLTLAHITHNTAVVLLHQGIAYPSPAWQALPVNLPSVSSAKTCMSAAIEVSIIAAEFLRNSLILTNPQFAFCLFICGRMLITHSLYYNVQLPAEFDHLISSLGEMSRRWNGDNIVGNNLAAKFALRLNHARHSGDPALDIRQAAYSEDQFDGPDGSSSFDLSRDPPVPLGENFPAGHTQAETPDSITLAFPPLPLAFQAQPPTRGQTALLSPSMNYLSYSTLGHSNDGLDRAATIPPVASFVGANGDMPMDHLASFLDYSFLPAQRVSAFSSLPTTPNGSIPMSSNAFPTSKK